MKLYISGSCTAMFIIYITYCNWKIMTEALGGGGDYPNIWLNKWWSGKVFNSQNSNHAYTLHQEWYAYFYCFGVGFFCVNGQLSRTMNFREEVVILYFWYWKKNPLGCNDKYLWEEFAHECLWHALLLD